MTENRGARVRQFSFCWQDLPFDSLGVNSISKWLMLNSPSNCIVLIYLNSTIQILALTPYLYLKLLNWYLAWEEYCFDLGSARCGCCLNTALQQFPLHPPFQIPDQWFLKYTRLEAALFHVVGQVQFSVSLLADAEATMLSLSPLHKHVVVRTPSSGSSITSRHTITGSLLAYYKPFITPGLFPVFSSSASPSLLLSLRHMLVKALIYPFICSLLSYFSFSFHLFHTGTPSPLPCYSGIYNPSLCYMCTFNCI